MNKTLARCTITSSPSRSRLSLSPARNPLRRPISEANPFSSLSALHQSHARGPSPLSPPRAGRTTTSSAELHRLSLFSLHAQNSSHSQKEIDPKTVPFSSVDKDDWAWVIENVYEDENFHERSMKNAENRKRLPYNHCMGSKSFKAAMHALADPGTGEEPHIVEFYRESHYNKKKNKWMDPKCQEIHEKLVAEREKCTQEGAIQLTQEQISINVLGGRSGYLRGFGNGPKPTSTTRSTRTDIEDGERGALQATVERLQNENAARSQEMEQMKNNQVAMQRQMEEMMRLVTRVTGLDMMTQGGVLT